MMVVNYRSSTVTIEMLLLATMATDSSSSCSFFNCCQRNSAGEAWMELIVPIPILSIIINFLDGADYYSAVRVSKNWLTASRFILCRTPLERQNELFYLAIEEEDDFRTRLRLLKMALGYSEPFKCHIYGEIGDTLHFNDPDMSKVALDNFEKAIQCPPEGSDRVIEGINMLMHLGFAVQTFSQ